MSLRTRREPGASPSASTPAVDRIERAENANSQRGAGRPTAEATDVLSPLPKRRPASSNESGLTSAQMDLLVYATARLVDGRPIPTGAPRQRLLRATAAQTGVHRIFKEHGRGNVAEDIEASNRESYYRASAVIPLTMQAPGLQRRDQMDVALTAAVVAEETLGNNCEENALEATLQYLPHVQPGEVVARPRLKIPHALTEVRVPSDPQHSVAIDPFRRGSPMFVPDTLLPKQRRRKDGYAIAHSDAPRVLERYRQKREAMAPYLQEAVPVALTEIREHLAADVTPDDPLGRQTLAHPKFARRAKANMAARSLSEQKKAVIDAARTVLDDERDIQAAAAAAEHVIQGVLTMDANMPPPRPSSRIDRWLSALSRGYRKLAKTP